MTHTAAFPVAKPFRFTSTSWTPGGKKRRRLIFVDFVLNVDEVKMVFTQFLQVANVIVADRVAFAKGRALKLAGTNFSDVVGQFRSDGFFYLYLLQHDRFSFCMTGVVIC